MKRLFSIMGLIAFTGLIFTSCTKDEEKDEPVLPVIAFNQQPGFITGDISAAYGDTLKFGIILQGNGKDDLIQFVIKANDDVLLDSTIKTQNFKFDFYTIKSPNPKDVWSFSTKDAAGNQKEESITVTGDFGPINSYTAILMGAQTNTTNESFLSLHDNQATLYMQAQAFQNQAKIDMFCYYETAQSAKNKMSLASPGSNLSGFFGSATSPENYTIKNLTKFAKTTYTAADFDSVKTDAILFSGFNSSLHTDKANALEVNDVYAFRTQSGLIGMFKVLEVNGDASGTLKIDIKIQKEIASDKSFKIYPY